MMLANSLAGLEMVVLKVEDGIHLRNTRHIAVDSSKQHATRRDMFLLVPVMVRDFQGQSH